MLLIIFGAGASYDHDQNAGIIPGYYDYPKLPLANDLIDANLSPARASRSKWRSALPLMNRLEILKGDRSFSIEEALYNELQRGNQSVEGQLLAFKFYVHEIVKNTEGMVRDRNQANTNYTLLLDRLQQNGIDTNRGISFVTFNYDCLLDEACSQIYPEWEFRSFDDYITGHAAVRLYKPHGSLDWKQVTTVAHQPDPFTSVIKILVNPKKFDAGETIQQITYNLFEHSQYVTNGNLATEPIIALPYREKTTFVFPDKHKRALIEDMSKITHILTIGWRGAEKHFHNEILSKIPHESKIKILNVNTGSQDIEENLRASLKARIESMQTFNKGFSSFIQDNSLLENFINN